MFKLNIYGNPKFERMINRIFKKSGDSIIINNSLEVDNNGDTTIGRDLFVEDEIVIDSADKIVDTDGNPIKIGNGQISSGTATNGQLLMANGSGGASWGNLPYITTEPTEANTNGLIICVLTAEPSTKYSGYLYIITA